MPDIRSTALLMRQHLFATACIFIQWSRVVKSVIDEMCIIWQGLKFVAGRPQSQGAVERLNASLKKNWRFGCVKITAQSGLWVCNLSGGKSTSALNTT
ncbi:hypothetical protein T10_13513 [Trichinella papuae]|uniref:Uncharacterized protein n=1 Tax=Trichinella papuae TaxID=268474 RepID=A0A0V1MMC7_9BILA|nr:hypothetical protein T10_13513 [Trichinella papuae]